MLYEYELKYRTELEMEEFEAIVEDYFIHQLPIVRTYTDIYRYKEDEKYFLRLRSDPAGTHIITFKEEKPNGNNQIRKEVNLDGGESAFETIADLLGLNLFKEFIIEKNAIIYPVNYPYNADLSWYEVNGDQRFIEIEYIGDSRHGKRNLLKLAKQMDEAFEDSITLENKSLFAIYKPKPKKKLPFYRKSNYPVCKL
jgi:adenylate cyclase class IV